MWRSCLILALIAGPALAENGWTPLAGAAAVAALSGRVLVYPDGATQSFAPGGDTAYDSVQPQEGKWRIEGAQYCSRWPPSDLWSCYALEAGAEGRHLRFIAADGSITEGRVIGE